MQGRQRGAAWGLQPGPVPGGSGASVHAPPAASPRLLTPVLPKPAGDALPLAVCGQREGGGRAAGARPGPATAGAEQVRSGAVGSQAAGRAQSTTLPHLQAPARKPQPCMLPCVPHIMLRMPCQRHVSHATDAGHAMPRHAMPCHAHTMPRCPPCRAVHCVGQLMPCRCRAVLCTALPAPCSLNSASL